MEQTASTPTTIRQVRGWQRAAIEILSIFTLLIGVVMLILLVDRIRTDSGINEVLDWTASQAEDPESAERPSLILAFLHSFGIIFPGLIILAGILFIRLGLRLRRLDINAARWAQVTFAWLAVISGLIGALQFTIRPPNLDTVLIALPFAAAALVFGAALVWLNRYATVVFVNGEVSYQARETRTAWSLLVPTIIVLVIVAARPLEQTFINSLTDKTFASQRVPQFVGMENYLRLSAVSIDMVECRRDEAGDCRTNPRGEIRWEAARLEDRYFPVWTWNIPLITDDHHAISVSAKEQDWIESIWTTLQFVVASVSLELVIGLFIALSVNSAFKGRGLMRAVMLVPWAIPTVISARLWELILKDSTAGILNRVLLDLSLIDAPRAWLARTPEQDFQIVSAVMIDVWKTSPFMALLLLAGLQTIPNDLYEAAAVDGANRIRQFFHITLPMLRPTIAVALVFRTLDALRVFDLFNVLFGRQKLTMATYNYETLVNDANDGLASATGVYIFVLILIFAIGYVRFLGVETE